MNSEELSKKIFEILSTQGDRRFFFRGIFVTEMEGHYQIRYVFSPAADSGMEDITLKTSIPVPLRGKREKLKSLGDVSSIAIWMEQEISVKFPIDFMGGIPFKELSILNTPRTEEDDKTGDLIL